MKITVTANMNPDDKAALESNLASTLNCQAPACELTVNYPTSRRLEEHEGGRRRLSAVATAIATYLAGATDDQVAALQAMDATDLIAALGPSVLGVAPIEAIKKQVSRALSEGDVHETQCAAIVSKSFDQYAAHTMSCPRAALCGGDNSSRVRLRDATGVGEYEMDVCRTLSLTMLTGFAMKDVCYMSRRSLAAYVTPAEEGNRRQLGDRRQLGNRCDDHVCPFGTANHGNMERVDSLCCKNVMGNIDMGNCAGDWDARCHVRGGSPNLRYVFKCQPITGSIWRGTNALTR